MSDTHVADGATATPSSQPPSTVGACAADSAAPALAASVAMASSCVAPGVAGSSAPFDWYADPRYYDAIFAEDTPVEAHMLRELFRTFTRPPASGSGTRSSEGDCHPQAATTNTPVASGVAPLSSSSAVSSSPLPICFEPACGSGRLMLALASDFRQVGFDRSQGAVDFARDRWNEREKEEEKAREQAEEAKESPAETLKATNSNPNDTQTKVDTSSQQSSPTSVMLASPSSSASASASHESSPLPPPPFTVFVSELSSFLVDVASHCPDILGRVSLAHCLVSSLKHLLDARDVFRHFEQVHAVLREDDGLYIVALHIHTLDGADHFARRVTYGPPTDLAHRDGPVCDPDEVEEEFVKEFTLRPEGNANANSTDASSSSPALLGGSGGGARPAARQFKAELLTYSPDTERMVEKMIARVHIDDAVRAESGTNAAGSPSSSSSSSSMETSMSLRVYTLSSVHTLLCSLAPLFDLAACYSYSDIYLGDAWSPDEFQLTWPYPQPSLDQLRTTERPHPTHPTIATEVQARRNWNRVYPVDKSVRDEWEEVEAIVLVLRKRKLDDTDHAAEREHP